MTPQNTWMLARVVSQTLRKSSQRRTVTSAMPRKTARHASRLKMRFSSALAMFTPVIS
jgi:hypothetical protein